MTIEYFDYNKEWILAIIGGIKSCELPLYIFIDTFNRNVTFYIIIIKR